MDFNHIEKRADGVPQPESANITMSMTPMPANIGGNGNDVLTDPFGLDYLDGGLGADTMTGGTGDDLYVVDNAGDVVVERPGEGIDTVRVGITGTGGKAVTYTLGANVENAEVADGFTGVINLTGNELDNQLTSNGMGSVLTGGAGNDTLKSLNGPDSLVADTLVGGTGNDTYYTYFGNAKIVEAAGQGIDTVVTWQQSYTLGANLENLVYEGVSAEGFNGTGNALDNAITGGAGDDTLSGGAGNDTLAGISGNDTIDGGAGSDTVVLSGSFADWTVSHPTADTVILTNPQVATADGTAAAQVTLTNVEFVQFSDGVKTLAQVLGGTPSAFNDSLIGTDGNDTLDGGAGNDTMVGGKGDDTYYVADSGDVVTEQPDEGRDAVLTTLSKYALGANVEDLVYTGAGAFTGTGNALNNVIVGGDNGSKLDGGAGNDKLVGGSGADSLVGGLGDDTIISGGGKDTVDGGDGTDVLQLQGDFADYTTTRINATDTLLTDSHGVTLTVRGVEMFDFNGTLYTLAQVQRNVPTPFDDVLQGTSGADTINGLAGKDTMAGGAGDDTYVVDQVGDVVVENPSEGKDTVNVAYAAAGTYTLTANVENATVTAGSGIAINLTGNELDNALTGNAAANTLTGGAGNDTLDGGAGADKLIGGTGDDTYYVDNAGDVVTEALNEGTDSVLTTLSSYTLGANVENLKVNANIAFTGTGNALDNIIIGADKGNKLDGGAGNDSLVGGLGNDSLIGGAGNDTIVAGLGKDTVDGGDGADVLRGLGNYADYTVTRPSAVDTLLTDKAGNTISVRGVEKFIFADAEKSLDDLQYNIASVGNDKLYGDAAANTLDGLAGADTLAGGAGDDTYLIDNVGDVIVENADEGKDTALVALSAAGTYKLGDNVENATVTAAASIAVNLTGNDLANALTGNAAANTLTGGAGNDTLDGGAGADKLIGGTGDDTYYVDNAGDIVTEALNEGTDSVLTTLSSYTLGANVENLKVNANIAFTGTGNALDNIIIGADKGNKLDGGAGNDSLVGGLGNDSLIGGAGNDTIVAGLGKDTVDGGDGADVLRGLGNYADYTVTRPSAVDTLLTDKAGNTISVRGVEKFIFADAEKSLDDLQYNIASIGNDKLYGDAAANTLDGLAGADTLAGGAGDDTYLIDNVGDVIVENADEGKDTALVALSAAGTYKLGDNVENATVTAAASIAVNLTGNDLANALTGNAAANTLTGGGGNDTLDGGAGADKLIGGTGDDTYYVDNAGDVVTEALNEGTDSVLTTLSSYTLGANVENLKVNANIAFTGTGNALDNIIIGADKGNKLDGGAGNDSLVGGLGNDSLIGGLGDDTMDAGSGKDTVDGGLGTDVLKGLGDFSNYTITRPTALDTVLTDKAGNSITVRGVESFIFNGVTKSLEQVQDNIVSPVNDSLRGTDGDDNINGGAGADTMAGGLGNDTYTVDVAGDVVTEAADEGNDTVNVAFTVAGTYALTANVENAIVTAGSSLAVNLTGNELANKLTGNAAANTLIGGAGNDTLDGGAGADKLVGGTGDDTYVVDNSGDTVTELVGEGTDLVKTTLASYTLGDNVENLTFTGSAAFTGTGNALDNIIIGGDKGNKLDGGAGNDSLVGGLGADSLAGGAGNDTLSAGAGKDTIDGGADTDLVIMTGAFGSYKITRPNATDTVLTDASGNVTTVRNVENFHFADGDKTLLQVQDNIISAGDDNLRGTAGNDTMDGGTGVDTLSGGLGDDTYVISNVNTKVVEGVGEGKDLAQVALTVAGTYVLADNLENATVTAAASVAVNLTGNDLANKLVGNAAVNILIGGAGDDTLDGGAGNDKLVGGIGNDTYMVDASGDTITELDGEGTDLVISSAASYTLSSYVENLTYTGNVAFTGIGNAQDNIITGGAKGNKLDGGAGNDSLIGGNGNDSLIGGTGNDTLVAGLGKDTIDGGDGSDLLQIVGKFTDFTVTRPNATDVVLTDKSGNVLTVRNVETFVFADGAKSLDDVQGMIGSVGNDHLHGTANADVLDGGAGIDTMEGGLGNDIYVLDTPDDVVIEAAKAGTDLVTLAFTKAATYLLAANVENATVIASDSVAVNVTGNELDNWIIGNGAANVLNGGAGNDTLQGAGGADTLIGGAGNDIYIIDGATSKAVVVENEGEGVDQVTTSLSAYTLPNNVENLVVRSQTGSITFTGTGNALDNRMEMMIGVTSAKLDGGAGNDTLIGSGGNDTLLGGDGDDRIEVSGGKDIVDGGNGVDTLVLAYPLGNAASFKVKQISASDIQLTDAKGFAVTVRGVESFVFSDVTLSLEKLTQNLHGVGTSADVIASVSKMGGNVEKVVVTGEHTQIAILTGTATVTADHHFVS